LFLLPNAQPCAHCEIAGLPSNDAAVSWAQQAVAKKNRLSSADAKLLEDAFERRLEEFKCSL
jgi:hypothetical protein